MFTIISGPMREPLDGKGFDQQALARQILVFQIHLGKLAKAGPCFLRHC